MIRERIAIIGTREPSEAISALVRKTIAAIPHEAILVSGGAPGVDSIVAGYKLQWFVVEFHAPWTRFHNPAGPMRNALIADYADRCIAFPSEKSRGTWNCVREFKRLGKPVEIIRP